MSGRNLKLSAALLAAAAAYVLWFTDWLHPTPIEVLPELREARPGRRAGPVPTNQYAVSFALDGRYRLTSLKVVHPGTKHVLWQLEAGTNAATTKAIIYGRPVPGMKPVAGAGPAEPLEPDVPYELQIASGRRRGTAIFQTHTLPPPAAAE